MDSKNSQADRNSQSKVAQEVKVRVHIFEFTFFLVVPVGQTVKALMDSALQEYYKVAPIIPHSVSWNICLERCVELCQTDLVQHALSPTDRDLFLYNRSRHSIREELRQRFILEEEPRARVVTAMENFTTTGHLVVSMKLTQSILKGIVDLTFPRSNSLSYLNLSHSALATEELKTILPVVLRACNLKVLNFEHNHITTEDLKLWWGWMVKAHKKGVAWKLETLNLSFNWLNQQSEVVLEQFVTMIPSLKSVIVSKHQS